MKITTNCIKGKEVDADTEYERKMEEKRIKEHVSQIDTILLTYNRMLERNTTMNDKSVTNLMTFGKLLMLFDFASAALLTMYSKCPIGD